MKSFIECKLAFGIVAAIILIASVPSFAEENAEKTNTQNILEAYSATHNEIISSLEQAKQDASKISKLINELNRLSDLMTKNKKNEKQYAAYQQKINEKIESTDGKYNVVYSVLSWYFPNWAAGNVQQKKVETIINDTTAIYRATLNCFNQAVYSGIKQCESMKKQACSNYGSEDGKMYYHELTADLELNEIDVSISDPRMPEPSIDQAKETLLFRDNYNFCRLLSLTTKSFPPAIITKLPVYQRLIKDFYGFVIPSASGYKKICIDAKPTEIHLNRLQEARAQYPNEWILTTYNNDFTKWKSACKRAAQEICVNSYTIKDQVILAYETVACQIREVTKEDVEHDIRLMDMHSDKLKHAALLDTIDVCQAAHDDGIFWPYQKPKLSNTCQKENKMPKKKGSK